MKKNSKKADVVVYTADVDYILRQLLRDLIRYFKVVDTGHCRTNTGSHDCTFSHWIYKLATRHFSHRPVKKVRLINDYEVDGRSFAPLIPCEKVCHVFFEVHEFELVRDVFASALKQYEVLLCSPQMTDEVRKKYEDKCNAYQQILNTLSISLKFDY